MGCIARATNTHPPHVTRSSRLLNHADLRDQRLGVGGFVVQADRWQPEWLPLDSRVATTPVAANRFRPISCAKSDEWLRHHLKMRQFVGRQLDKKGANSCNEGSRYNPHRSQEFTPMATLLPPPRLA